MPPYQRQQQTQEWQHPGKPPSTSAMRNLAFIGCRVKGDINGRRPQDRKRQWTLKGSLGCPLPCQPSSTSLADSHLGPVASTSNTNRAPGARPQTGIANASDHSSHSPRNDPQDRADPSPSIRLPASELLLRLISTCLPYYLRRYPPVCLVNWVIPGVKHG